MAALFPIGNVNGVKIKIIKHSYPSTPRVRKIIFKNIFFYKINLLNFRISNCKSQITRLLCVNLLKARAPRS
jgi:hypothetical protein